MDRCHDDPKTCETSAIDCLQDGNEGILVPETIPLSQPTGQGGPFAKRLERPGGHDSPGSIEPMTPTGSPVQSRSSSPARERKQGSPTTTKTFAVCTQRRRSSATRMRSELLETESIVDMDEQDTTFYPAPIPASMRTPPALVGSPVQVRSMSMPTECSPLANLCMPSEDEAESTENCQDGQLEPEEMEASETKSDAYRDFALPSQYSPATLLLSTFLEQTANEPVPTDDEIHRDAVAMGALLDIVKLRHQRQKERALPGYTLDARSSQRMDSITRLSMGMPKWDAPEAKKRPTLLTLDMERRALQRSQGILEMQQARSGHLAGRSTHSLPMRSKRESAGVKSVNEALRFSLQLNLGDEDDDDDVPLAELCARDQQRMSPVHGGSMLLESAEQQVNVLSSLFAGEQSLAARMEALKVKQQQNLRSPVGEKELGKPRELTLAERRAKLLKGKDVAGRREGPYRL
ncbi:hypothetical protein BCR37DRAFT_389189 [Protomyces lactucae-debilis]|uniref:Uncharacterized protein n=1 Tax=Protomyces lactucae-debilis TaxID=2754530 RepID=A0A1Y2F0L2_PROLT|nr:uncharacterized protein BCR37DRAFT_389189 [Protomyces lactucae-debilis]ORY77380.1 hypothetical protein BCR37DRAFT_389189 [Protomyces lactucae-debilis]